MDQTQLTPNACCVQRIKYWIVCGAQPTDRIATILGNANILPAKLNYRWKESNEKKKEAEKK
jgi:ribosomal protein S16